MAEEVGRYVVCPASGFLHGPRAVLVQRTLRHKRWHAACACGTFVWLTRYKEGSGYTLEEVRARGFELDGPRLDYGPVTAEPEERFYVCPLSFYAHEGQAPVPVEKGKKSYTGFCRPCASRTWFGKRWRPEMGWTSAMLDAQGIANRSG